MTGKDKNNMTKKKHEYTEHDDLVFPDLPYMVTAEQREDAVRRAYEESHLYSARKDVGGLAGEADIAQAIKRLIAAAAKLIRLIKKTPLCR